MDNSLTFNLTLKGIKRVKNKRLNKKVKQGLLKQCCSNYRLII